MLNHREMEKVVLTEIKRLPDRLEPLPEDHFAWAAKVPMTLAPIRAWRSKSWVVQLYDEHGNRRLSIQRSKANAGIRPANRDLRPISWDELMAVKAEAGFGICWAIEIFPPDDEVVDVAPMRHLWLLDGPPPQAWRKV